MHFDSVNLNKCDVMNLTLKLKGLGVAYINVLSIVVTLKLKRLGVASINIASVCRRSILDSKRYECPTKSE